MTESTATERVGRYQLLEPIGAGPTGHVSRAKVFGVAGFERQFAVKRFLTEVSATGPAALALSAAARAYSNLEHPRIARMTEFGVSQGTTFTAVEYVAGIDMLRLMTEARLAGATLQPGGALALVSQAARAVGYAHGRGISHLGLAPTNVIVTADGDVKITDFAVLAATLPTRPVELPRLAQRIGYLAPEQIAGEATSAATDVFALGVLAFELVTSHRAFEGDSPARIAQAVVAGPPAELPLPRPIARVLQRCLARSPFERFPDAGAFADALDAALRVAPVPGSRKDIGALVKELVDRLANLRDGAMSGMLALDVNTAPRLPTADPLSRLALDDDDEPPTATPTRADTDLGVPLAAATQPELAKPMMTVTGLPPPPIPVPHVHTPPPLPAIPTPGLAATLIGVTRERLTAMTPSAPVQVPQIIHPRTRPGSSGNPPTRMPTPPAVSPAASSATSAAPPPIPRRVMTPLAEAIEAAMPALPDDDEATVPPTEPPPLPRTATPPRGIERRDGTPIPRAATPPPVPMDRRSRAPAQQPLFAASPAGEQVIADATDRAKTMLDARTEPGITARPTPAAVPATVPEATPTSREMPTTDMRPIRAERGDDLGRALGDLGDDAPQDNSGRAFGHGNGEGQAGIGTKTVFGYSPAPTAPPPALLEADEPEIAISGGDLANDRAATGAAPIELAEPVAEAPVASGLRIPTRVPTPLPTALPQAPTGARDSSRRSRAPFAIVAVLVLAGGGGVAAWQLGAFAGAGDEPAAHADAAVIAQRALVATTASAIDAAASFDATAAATIDAAATPAAAIDAAVVVAVADAQQPAVDAGSMLGSNTVATSTGSGSAGVGSASVSVGGGVGSAGAGSATPAIVQITPGSDLGIRATPAAHAFLDGSDAGATPVSKPGAADRHTLVLYALGYDLYVGKVDGKGTIDVALTQVAPFTGEAGIKVIHCKDKDRYYVYVDGKPTGQTCPTEQRINCTVGAHVVEVYDAQTDKRRSWNITVTDTRLSYRVRVDDTP